MDFSWPVEYSVVFFWPDPYLFFSSIIFCVHLFIPRILAKLDSLLVPKYKVCCFLRDFASFCPCRCHINIVFFHGTFKALIRGFLVYQASLSSCDSQVLARIRITWRAFEKAHDPVPPRNCRFNRSGVGRAWQPALPVSSQVTRMPQVWRPHFEN